MYSSLLHPAPVAASGVDSLASHVADFNKPNTDIRVIPGQVPPGLPERIKTAVEGSYRDRVTNDTAERKVANALAELNLADPALAADLVALIPSFLRCFQVAKAGLRIELVSEVMCPKFHIDNMHVRMIKTYVGPGTQYVYTHRKEHIQQAAAGDVVLLKGEKHPTQSGTVLHRSPHHKHHASRLILVLDY